MLCVQPFVLIFLIFVIRKYRRNTFVMLKRLGVRSIEFWCVGLVFSFTLCYLSLVVLYGFSMLLQ